jgi:hypothetical protein
VAALLGLVPRCHCSFSRAVVIWIVTLVKKPAWSMGEGEVAMGMAYLMMVAFPPLEEFYKLLAVVVALYFPLAMLTWVAIDKLHNMADDRIEARRQEPAQGRGQLTFNQNPRRQP